MRGGGIFEFLIGVVGLAAGLLLLVLAVVVIAMNLWVIVPLAFIYYCIFRFVRFGNRRHWR